MRMDQMPGYGLPTLAMWPERWEYSNRWVMYDYKLRIDGSLKWYRSFFEDQNGFVKGMVYDSFEEARAAAIEANKNLVKNLESLALSDEIKGSLSLKVEKAIDCKGRLQNEEQLMLQEAIRRHADDPRPAINKLVLPEHYESVRQSVSDYLNETPYVNHVPLDKHHIVLGKKGENDWSSVFRMTQKAAKYAYRDRIASGYGLSANDNWKNIKSAIRKLLLPRANELLQLASIKRLLDTALAKGQKVLVVNNFVFWFEEGSDGIGWIVKEASESDRSKNGNTLWKEGTIISKNHGRIVVLPYTKENGEHVQGHTKNVSGDGKAKPRHPKEYVELPFEVLEDDLMIGLFGELKYE